MAHWEDELGNFYGNIAVRGVEHDAIVEWLRAAPLVSWVGPSQRGWTVFSDPNTDRGDLFHATRVMLAVANAPSCIAVAAIVHDDDVLMMTATANGNPVFQYNSNAAYFADSIDPGPTPTVQGEEKLLDVLGLTDVGTELHQLLWRPGDFVFATELHAELIRVLELPEYAVGFGYGYADSGEPPSTDGQFIKIGV